MSFTLNFKCIVSIRETQYAGSDTGGYPNYVVTLDIPSWTTANVQASESVELGA